MSDLPKISIVTPSFNQGAFLEATIQSVLEQHYPNLEYIIMDGGSTDHSVEIIRRYEKHLNYWVSETDAGQADAINTGFARCTGDILGWLNSDDTLIPGTLHRVAAIFQENPNVDVVYGDALNIDEEGNVLGVRSANPFSLAAILEDSLIPQPAAFFSRRAWMRHGPLDVHLHYIMDRALWLRIAEDMSFLYVPEALATMRRHAKAKTMRDKVQVKGEEKELLDAYYARTDLPPVALASRNASYGRLYYYLGFNQLLLEEYDAAIEAFYNSLRVHPFHRRILVILPMLLSAYLRNNRLAIHYPNWVQFLRRRLKAIGAGKGIS